MAESHPARKIQFVALSLVAAAALVGTATMFVPWEQWDLTEEGGQSRGVGDLWGYHERNGPIAHDREGWFNNRETFDNNDQNELSQLRFAAIVALVGLGALVAGAATILLDHKMRAAATATTGAVLMLVATVVHHNAFLDFANIHVEATFGYYMGIGAGFLGLMGGLLAFIPHPGLGLREKFTSWNQS